MRADRLTYLTDAFPGVGGTIRRSPEDFVVEERPLYLPAGEGEHLYLRVTKRRLSTPHLVARLASELGVKAMRIGVAGQKDARAVTTQMVSIQGVTPDQVGRLKTDDRVLQVEVLGRHRNRLRPGHHAGNRFRIVVRDVGPAAAEIVPQVLSIVAARGLPNYFGPQRQGPEGRNYEIGAALLLDAERRGRLSRTKRLWYLHAYQSRLFNLILSRRLPHIDRVEAGDWAMKHANGACFLVQSPDLEQPRVERFEISPTGVLFGSRAPWAEGRPGALERAAAAALETTPERLTEAGKACGFRGERRPLRVAVQELDWRLDGGALTLTFALPAGAYATSLLRELTKVE